MLEPARIGYMSLDVTSLGYDWVHANAVTYDPSDDSIIVSVRHQDSVVTFSRSTGDLIWILGPHYNWPPEFPPHLLTPRGAPFSCQYHEHAPMITPEGTLLLFDNGNFRATPFDGKPLREPMNNLSRGVEYKIDDQDMTVEQVWQYTGTPQTRTYSGSRGDAEWQPRTRNVLMTFSASEYVGGGTPSCDLGFGGSHTRIVEASHDRPVQRLFELAVYDVAGLYGDCATLIVYRSERIPSLYPSTVRVLSAPGMDVHLGSPVAPRGGSLSYTATVTNTAATTQCYDFRANVTLPDGSPFPAEGPAFGPALACVAPFDTSSRTFHQVVPANAPLGAYTFTASAGAYPAVPSSGQFDVEVSPYAGAGAAPFRSGRLGLRRRAESRVSPVIPATSNGRGISPCSFGWPSLRARGCASSPLPPRS